MFLFFYRIDSENSEEIEYCVTIEGGAVPSETVVRTIVQAKGISPLEMPALYEIVDPEALDAIFKGKDLSYIQFLYYGYKVIVVSDGRIIIQDCETNEGNS